MTSLQYWTNQFNKYGEPYYKGRTIRCSLEEYLKMDKKERRKLIAYLRKPSLLESINLNKVL